MSPAASPSVNLHAIARQVMLQYGFLVDFPANVAPELARAAALAAVSGPKDLTGWLWSSIDNDDSRDLDQIEYVQAEKDGTRVSVAIANVDRFAPLGSAIDAAAQHNTTSIYTGVQTFPMLPPQLSTDLSSLLEGQKRAAVVMEFLVSGDGTISISTVYPAIVQNKAQLTYEAVAAWLDSYSKSSLSPSSSSPSSSSSSSPNASIGDPGALTPLDSRLRPAGMTEKDVTTRILAKIHGNPELQKQLQLQDAVAQALRQKRHEAGALTLETSEFRPAVASDGSIDLKSHVANRATQLIEDFMIAANQATVAFLQSRKFPCVRRIVRTPKRWDRIVQLAAAHGASLPPQPDSKSLEGFLKEQRLKDPERFADLSLSVIKLLGRGEYVVSTPDQEAPGHFGLAVENYAHSTAPNRRYPDVLTHRLLLAAFDLKPVPYNPTDLQSLATHCTQKEDDANKVERTVSKCIAAVALAPRIGEIFPGIITGNSDKGVWVKILHPAVEGKLDGKVGTLDVGDKVQVRLSSTDPQRGYIDFELIKKI